LSLTYTVASIDERATFGDVAAFGSMIVAVGSVQQHERSVVTDSRAAVWLSGDGIAWQRAPDGPALGSATMTALTVYGRQLVAVGCSMSHSGSSGLMCDRAAAWTSGDGLGWHREVVDRVMPHGESILAVAAGPGPVGIVATGYACETPCGEGGHPAVWRSADGHSWSRDVLEATVFGADQPAGSCGLCRAWIINHTFLIASDALVGYGDESRSWTSADGIHWKLASRLPFTPSTVVVTGSGYVALGLSLAASDFSLSAWTSSDGVTWDRVVNPPAESWELGTMLLSVQSELIAVNSGYESPDTGTITSTLALVDLAKPPSEGHLILATPAPPDPEAEIAGLDSIGQTAVVVGNQSTGDATSPVLWSTTLP
jgi:hypothetical protein